jgi:hypothetical protein
VVTLHPAEKRIFFGKTLQVALANVWSLSVPGLRIGQLWSRATAELRL